MTAYGPVYCVSCCFDLDTKYSKITHYPEFTSDEIKAERKKYRKDILQPHREGQTSKEFIEAYPRQASKMFSPEEIKKAKNVWYDEKSGREL